MTSIDDQISSEREFLHSISTPLMISMSQLELLLTKKDGLSIEEILERVQKAKNSLDTVSDGVHSRRANLKAQMNA